MPSACFVYHPKGCERCSEYVEHLLEDMEQCPSKFSFTRDETLDCLQEMWPKLGHYIIDIGDEHDTLEKELAKEKSNNNQLQEEIKDLLNKIKVMETQIASLQTTQHSSDQSMTVTSPTDTYSSDRPNHWSLHMWKILEGWHTNPMSVPNAIRDDSEGYFLEEDIDVAAWISKISTDIPRSTFMHQMKVVFGSPLNVEMVFSGFEMNSLIPNHHSMRWITDSSTPIRVGSQINKGHKNESQVPAPVKLLTGAEFLTLVLKHCSFSKEQIYTQIIPYMERDDEKWSYSTAGMEHAAYMQLHHHPPTPNKGKRPMTGSLQSQLTAHALQPAKTGESSQQRLDVDLDVYHQAREPVLPYDEEPPHGVPDVEMSTPVVTGASSTLHDESTMNIDHELHDLYD
ncbi:hypothetical protein M422DRAFT_243721 [Sphaerobolus stellatus SS14]|nr:hypothetical protein M422DRAFT_243721 [Sphaerobolus stellatus SS14]